MFCFIRVNYSSAVLWPLLRELSSATVLTTIKFHLSVIYDWKTCNFWHKIVCSRSKLFAIANIVSVRLQTLCSFWMHAIHRCRSRQIFGGAKNFCPNLRKFARTKSKKNTTAVFSSQGTSSTIFAQILPKLVAFLLTCPKTSKLKHDCQKKCLHLHFVCLFCKFNAHTPILQCVYTYFAQISSHFAQILRGFARIFTKSNLLEVRLQPLHPRPQHQWHNKNVASDIANSLIPRYQDIWQPVLWSKTAIWCF